MMTGDREFSSGDPSQRNVEALLSTPRMKDFLEDREIRPEDLPLVEALASVPKNVLISGLHNMFGTYKERSVNELKGLVEQTKDETRATMYKTALAFCEKYGWPASWNLVVVLENT